MLSPDYRRGPGYFALFLLQRMGDSEVGVANTFAIKLLLLLRANRNELIPAFIIETVKKYFALFERISHKDNSCEISDFFSIGDTNYMYKQYLCNVFLQHISFS